MVPRNSRHCTVGKPSVEAYTRVPEVNANLLFVSRVQTPNKNKKRRWGAGATSYARGISPGRVHLLVEHEPRCADEVIVSRAII